MILSYHPCYEADMNLLCAGRDPDANDLAAIRRAAAVILPQGCRQPLYDMARNNCRHVFPNYDIRFAYPGKTGQARLFKTFDVPHPQTWAFDNLAQFNRWRQSASRIEFPKVFKLDWGGEGQTVTLLESDNDLDRALARAKDHEQSGQPGFLLQTVVAHANRTLRVVVIKDTFKIYWRVQNNPHIFGSSLVNGAMIDHAVSASIRREALSLTRRFCRQTKINLAGLDLIFDASALDAAKPQPLILEINYFFGRTGLGGSTPFYAMLQTQIHRWLTALGLKISPLNGEPALTEQQ